MRTLYVTISLVVLAIFASTTLANLDEERRVIAELEQWVNARGLDTSKLYVNFDAPVRGLFTRTAIKKGEVLIRVRPDSGLMITSQLMSNSRPYAHLATLKDVDSFIDSHLRAGLWILQQKFDPNSEWRPWIASLPKNFTVPQVACSEQDLALVSKFYEGQVAAEHRAHSKLWIPRAFKFLEENFFPLFRTEYPADKMTVEQLEWAWYAVRTRSWDNLQVPWADMFNHNPAGPLPGREAIAGTQDSAFIFVADRDYEANEEVFISYGPKDDMSLWVTYGFAPESNLFSCVTTITIPDRVGNSYFQSVVAPNRERFMPNPKVCVTAHGHGLAHLFQNIRLQALTEEDMKYGNPITEKPGPISLLNEYSAFRESIVLFEKMRREFEEQKELENQILLENPGNQCVLTVLHMRDRSRAVVPALIERLRSHWTQVLLDGTFPKLLTNPHEELQNAQIAALQKAQQQQQQQQQQQKPQQQVEILV